MLFEREGMEFRFGRNLKGKNKIIADLTRTNSLYLSAAAQNDHSYLSKIYNYFKMIRTVRDIAIPGVAASMRLLQEDDKGPDQRVINFLGEIDTGIVNFRRREVDLSEDHQTFQRELTAMIEKMLKESLENYLSVDTNRVEFDLGHSGEDNTTFYLELERESAGTRRLLIVLSRVFVALDKGALICIDELDASLHTHAVETLLKLFCSPTINRNGAQLVATTHDTNLMSSNVLRRDQLWFTEKEIDGATRLYPLTEIRTRKGDSIEKGYRQGRYGAVPIGDPIVKYDTSIKT